MSDKEKKAKATAQNERTLSQFAEQENIFEVARTLNERGYELPGKVTKREKKKRKDHGCLVGCGKYGFQILHWQQPKQCLDSRSFVEKIHQG